MPEPALITVVVGDEELLVDRAVAAVVAQARAAEPDPDVPDPMPSQVGLSTLVDGTSPSLFRDHPIRVLRSAQVLPKDLAVTVTDYRRAAAHDVTMVPTPAGGAQGKALLQAALQAGAHRLDWKGPPNPAERVSLVRGEFLA